MLILKLRHICVYPAKYNKIKGYDEYLRSSWYWNPRISYSAGDPPSQSTQCCIYLMVLIAVFYFLFQPANIGIWGHRGSTVILTPMAAVSMSCGFIFAIIVSYVQPIFSKKPMKICFTLFHLFKGKQRHVVWKRSIIILLVSCCIYFPIHIVGFFNYGYADNEKLVYSPAHTVNEYVFEYDSISRTEIVHGENGAVLHYYLYNPEGKRFDIYGFGCSEIRPVVLDKIVVE